MPVASDKPRWTEPPLGGGLRRSWEMSGSVVVFVKRSGGAERRALRRVPALVSAIHVSFLAGVVAFAHHPVVFLGLFLMVLGFAQAYE